MQSPIHQITNSPDCRRLVDREGLAATAGGRRVRVLDGEAAARDRVDEVDFGTVEVADADRIDEQLHTVGLEHLVAGALTVLFDHQAILESRAAAALDEDAKAASGLVFLGQQLIDLGCRRFRHVDHVAIIARSRLVYCRVPLMPYVSIAAVSREKLMISAEARWRRIGETRPDLAPALALQRRLLDGVLDAAGIFETGRLPKLSLPPKYVAAKLARGVPAFAGEPIPVPVPVLTPTLRQLCDALAAGGAGEAAEHIKTAIDARTMDAGSLLTASLHRDQKALRTGAVHRGLSPDLLWLVAELAVSPFVHALQEVLIARTQTPELKAAFDGWTSGSCPFCGSWPALAEVAATHRALRCSFCALAWELNTYACVYCGEQGEPFVTAAPNIER